MLASTLRGPCLTCGMEWVNPHPFLPSVQDEGQFIDMDAYKLLREYLIAVGLDYDDYTR